MTPLAPPPSAAPCSDFVVESERDAVMEIIAQAGDNGLTMGAIVDALEKAGHSPASLEMAIWRLLQDGKIVPRGFVCRTIRRRDDSGNFTEFRCYEFVLIKTPEQMELPIS